MKKVIFLLAFVGAATSAFYVGRKRLKHGLPLLPFLKAKPVDIVPAAEFHPETFSNETALP